MSDPEVDKKLKEAHDLKEEAAIKKGTLKVEKKNDFKDINEEDDTDKKNIDSLANKGEKLNSQKKVDKAEDKIAQKEEVIKKLNEQGKEEEVQVLKDQIKDL